MFHLARTVFSPLISLFLVMLATGYFSTLFSLQLKEIGLASFTIGIITSAYYAGIIVGSFRIERVISRIGYIRTHAAFTAFSTVLVLIQAMVIDQPVVSLILRFFTGVCVGGFFVILEGWVLCSSNHSNRGQMMSLCMITLYLGYSLGQFFVSFSFSDEVIGYLLIAILTSLSCLPLALTKAKGPALEEPSVLGLKDLFALSPTGMFGCLLVGAIFSTVYSIFPIMFKGVGYENMDISIAMFMIIFGGMFGQYPLGKMSDIFERHKVLVLASFAATVLTFILFFTYTNISFVLYVVYFLFGAFCYPLYPLCISHTSDVVEKKDFTAAMQSLVLVFGIGCTAGPFLSSLGMLMFGNIGSLIFVALTLLAISAIFMWRRHVGHPVVPENKTDFMASTPTAPVVQDVKKSRKNN